MTSLGSYVNKADIINQNPYNNPTAKKQQWDRLLKNLSVSKAHLLLGDYASGDTTLSDGTSQPFAKSKWAYIRLLNYKVKSNGVVAALDTQAAMASVIRFIANYIEALETAGSNPSDAKQLYLRAQVTLVNAYSEVENTLKPQATSVVEQRAREAKRVNDARQWEAQMTGKTIDKIKEEQGDD